MIDLFEEGPIAAVWRATEGGPTPADLEGAPLLEDWELAYFLTGYTYAIGRHYGHPVESDGVRMITSAVVRVDMKRQWLRTVSRYFRLGTERVKDDKIEPLVLDGEVAFVARVNDERLEKLHQRNERIAIRLAERRN